MHDETSKGVLFHVSRRWTIQSVQLLRHQTKLAFVLQRRWRLHCVYRPYRATHTSLLWYDYRWRRMDGLYQHVFGIDLVFFMFWCSVKISSQHEWPLQKPLLAYSVLFIPFDVMLVITLPGTNDKAISLYVSQVIQLKISKKTWSKHLSCPVEKGHNEIRVGVCPSVCLSRALT